ncbi:preprotein translocase subunit SecG [Candidatus Azambacteria bacterium RBG_16_47_10]|uniref:Protein-export membrane protein SecG n=1 Tax=Candidatus Azambacteria bacterium RBG_16_47_10 TaxID=1797292 RepID=A0A1F5AY07_9BACT|nr:MAG: preprotein translocase subunit SecG [Candidatus Azambacteria bacterium RBG_16_47_10]
MFWFNILLIAVSTLLIVAILLQQRGEGISTVFGGTGGGAYHTKRGMEKFVFFSTIVLSTLFIGSAIMRLFF